MRLPCFSLAAAAFLPTVIRAHPAAGGGPAGTEAHASDLFVPAILVLLVMILIGIGILIFLQYGYKVRGSEQPGSEQARQPGTPVGRPEVDPGEAMGMIAHELRNPINPIIGMAEVIQQTAREEHIRHMGQTILDSGRDLKELVDSMLDYTRLHQGKLRLRPKDFHLVSLIEGVLGVHRRDAETQGLDLRLVMDDRLPEYVHGDADRLRQVINNLVSNALKYTPDGAITVEARAATMPASRPGFGPGSPFWLSISVTDTGIGIDRDDAERLFQPFYRSENARRSGAEGTGLGLSICREIIKAMQGTLTIQPGDQAGTVARLQVPVLASPEPRPGSS
jgi:signal transduction histidine kinase